MDKSINYISSNEFHPIKIAYRLNESNDVDIDIVACNVILETIDHKIKDIQFNTVGDMLSFFTEK